MEDFDIQTRALGECVSKLEAEMRFLYEHLGVTFIPAPFEIDPADKEVAEWLKKGDRMRALATYRGIHRVSVEEAVAAIDAIKAGLGLG